jgi:tetratricopeptide (TPR) repeat protein
MQSPVAAAALTAVLAQAVPQVSHPSHQLPVVPSGLLDKPTTLRADIAGTHDAAATSSADAQKFYDQGLTYLHHFVWIEAARSFNQALRHDRGLALAHVGLSYALAELNQSAAAREALTRARAAATSPHDRQHVLVRERQLAAEQGAPGALDSYRKAIDDALAEFPGDVELWLRRGVAEAPSPSDSGQGAPASATRYFERALSLAPDHFAAHHYLTHAYENSARTTDALRHGAAYARLAPDIPHARHMHGHNLRRVGRIREALAEFEAANTLEASYIKTEGIAPGQVWHYEHNLDLLGTSYQYAGQPSKAATSLEAAFGLPTANLVQAVNKRAWPVFLRSRGRVDEALAASAVLIAHPNSIVQALGYIERGYATLMKKQFAESAADSNRALAAMKRAPAGAGLVATAFEGLQGEFFLRTGQRDKGRQMLEAVARKERSTPGPDAWTQTLFTLEGFARAAREVGDWDFAALMAQQMVDHDPSYGGAHYALALAAERRGDQPTAQREWVLAEKYWDGAEASFPELREIRTKLGRTKP